MKPWSNASLRIVLLYVCGTLKSYFSADRVALFMRLKRGFLWGSYCVIVMMQRMRAFLEIVLCYFMRHWRSTSLEIILRYCYDAVKEGFSGDRIVLFLWGTKVTYFSGDRIALLLWGTEGVLLWGSYCAIGMRHWSISLGIVLRYLYEALKEYFSTDRIALFVRNPKRVLEILLLNYNLQMCCVLLVYTLLLTHVS